MNIIEQTYKWYGKFTKRKLTQYIVLHHRAGAGDVQSIHQLHAKQDYIGIGYHLYIRKDGTIYRGRPIETVGAHCVSINDRSVGICFEGNFENERMPEAQIKAGQLAVDYVKQLYPAAKIVQHKDITNTACPGKYFPFDAVTKPVVKKPIELTSANDIVWELSQRVTIYDVDGLVKALDKAKKKNSPLYWVLYKLVNK